MDNNGYKVEYQRDGNDEGPLLTTPRFTTLKAALIQAQAMRSRHHIVAIITPTGRLGRDEVLKKLDSGRYAA